jgi:hypothetical protein
MTSVQIETVELIEPWLYGVLNGDDTLRNMVGGRIENAIGPLTDTLVLPKVTFQLISPRDIKNAQDLTIDTSNLYDIEAIGQYDSWTPLTPIASRIHALIQGVAYSFPGGGSLTCTRDLTIQRPEIVEGATYRHLGGTYRIRCSKD